jgi:hypothetical protein
MQAVDLGYRARSAGIATGLFFSFSVNPLDEG